MAYTDRESILALGQIDPELKAVSPMNSNKPNLPLTHLLVPGKGQLATAGLFQPG